MNVQRELVGMGVEEDGDGVLHESPSMDEVVRVGVEGDGWLHERLKCPTISTDIHFPSIVQSYIESTRLVD